MFLVVDTRPLVMDARGATGQLAFGHFCSCGFVLDVGM
jgi:hypothetical protein